MPNLRRPLLVAVLVLASLLAAAPAQAFVIAGQAWPRHRVRIAITDIRIRGAMREAIALWNNSGANVHIRIVSRPYAQVYAVSPTSGSPWQCAGMSTVGAAPVGGHDWLQLQHGCNRNAAVLVATHELGHILGLGHVHGGCALMTPWTRSGCRVRTLPATRRWCFPWATDDLRGAVRLYGGVVRATPARLSCPR